MSHLHTDLKINKYINGRSTSEELLIAMLALLASVSVLDFCSSGCSKFRDDCHHISFVSAVVEFQ